MAKAKVITALALTVVMLVMMTGLAAADEADDATVIIADDPIINPLDGTSVTSSTVSVTILPQNGNCTRFISVKTTNENLSAKVNGSNPGGSGIVDTGWQSINRGGIAYDAPDGGTYTFTVWVKGTEEGQINVADNQGNEYHEQGSGYDEAACTRDVLVPEFTTIAIPVAAILGLLFFYNHRKRKEE